MLINEHARGWIRAFMGLRQGVFPFPFVFTIVVDSFSRLTLKAEQCDFKKRFLVVRSIA